MSFQQIFLLHEPCQLILVCLSFSGGYYSLKFFRFTSVHSLFNILREIFSTSLPPPPPLPTAWPSSCLPASPLPPWRSMLASISGGWLLPKTTGPLRAIYPTLVGYVWMFLRPLTSLLGRDSIEFSNCSPTSYFNCIHVFLRLIEEQWSLTDFLNCSWT